jgi:hypothetical protein
LVSTVLRLINQIGWIGTIDASAGDGGDEPVRGGPSSVTVITWSSFRRVLPEPLSRPQRRAQNVADRVVGSSGEEMAEIQALNTYQGQSKHPLAGGHF